MDLIKFITIYTLSMTVSAARMPGRTAINLDMMLLKSNLLKKSEIRAVMISVRDDPALDDTEDLILLLVDWLLAVELLVALEGAAVTTLGTSTDLFCDVSGPLKEGVSCLLTFLPFIFV